MSRAIKSTTVSAVHSASVTQVMVTPAMAVEWLECNVSNRTIRQSKVNQYARDMLRGMWKLTAEPIKFSASGRLLDGQHRLWAVIEADTAVPMFVARGLDEDVQKYMDTGIARTAADNLHMRGETHSHVLAAAARIGALVDDDLLFRDRKMWRVSHASIYQWIEANPSIRRSAGYVVSGEPHKVALPPSIKAYTHFRFSALEVDEADEFFASLGSLINLPSGSPIHALSSRLRNLERKRVRIDLADGLSVTIRAWNAWRRGKPLAVIPLVPSHGQRCLPDPI